MKKTRKFIALLLCFLMLFGSAPLSGLTEISFPDFKGLFAAKAAAVNIYTYTVSDGKATITEVHPSVFGYLTVPSTLDGYPVVGIGDSAFSYCYELTSVVLPDSIKSIGKQAFYYCYGMKRINIPDSVTSIGDGAFSVCRALISIEIPDSVTGLGDEAFKNCSALKSVTVGNGLKYMWDSTFSGCTALENVVISEGVTEIGWYAFENCTALDRIEIPEGVTEIGSYAFENCTSLKSVEIPESVTTIGLDVFSGCTQLKSIVVPGSVTTLGSFSFEDIPGLTGVTIEDGVTTIDNYAFRNCPELTCVFIPDSVTNIYPNAFKNDDLLAIKGNSGSYAERFCASYGIPFISSDTSPYWRYDEVSGELTVVADGEIPDYGLSDAPWYNYANNIKSVNIIGNITVIGNNAFRNCAITDIEIPEGVTRIGDSAFTGCSLNKITIPDSVTCIGDSAFANCSALTSVAIPNSVTTIGKYAFEDCHGLTSITIPGSVTSIGKYAFYCCGLISVTISDGVTSIGDFAFVGCTDLTSLTIGSDVRSIGDAAFSYCNSLKSIHIPVSVTSISSSAFSGYSNLEYICSNSSDCYAKTFAESNGFTFKLCHENPEEGSSFTYTINDGEVTVTGFNGEIPSDLVIPSEIEGYPVICIGNSAFKNCTGLTSITIPDSVTSISDFAFGYCTNLTNVAIPDSVTSMAASSFYNDNNLTVYGKSGSCADTYCAFRGIPFCTFYWQLDLSTKTLVVSGDGKIPDYKPGKAPWNGFASQIRNVTLDGVTAIGKNAFRNCAITSIDVPEIVTRIDEKAFYGCAKLESINIDSGNPNYESDARGVLFNKGKTDLILYPAGNMESSYILPFSVDSIRTNAFAGCKSLESLTGRPGSCAEECAGKFGVAFVPYPMVEITFDAVAGVCETTQKTVERGNVAGTLPGAVKDGFELIGWSMDEAGNELIDRNYVVNSNLKVFAVWKGISKLKIRTIYHTKYYTGESLLTYGMTFEVEYVDGTTRIIDADDVTFSQNRFLSPGKKIIVANYLGVKTSFSVEVFDSVPERLEILTLPDKTDYTLGEKLDCDGLTLKVIYYYRFEKIITSGYTVECDTSVVGRRTVTVSYTQDFFTVSTNFEINVSSPSPSAVPRVFSPEISAESGSIVAVPVCIENNTGFMGINIGMSYDSSVLTPVSVSGGAMLGGGMLNDSIGYSQPGFINVVYFGSEDITENSTMFTVMFRVLSNTDTSTAISLSYDEQDTFNESWNSIELDCNPITVNVRGAASQGAATLSFGEAVFGNDGTMRVPVIISGMNGVSSLGFEVNYDESVVCFDSTDIAVLSGTGKGKISFLLTDIQAEGKHTVGETVFSIIDSGSTEAALSFSGVTATNQTGQIVEVSAAPKNYNIEGKATAATAIFGGEIFAVPGSMVDVPLMIRNNPGLMGIALIVEYDPSLLTPVSVRHGDVTASGSFGSNEGLNSGEFKVIWFDNSQTTANGTLATLSFELSETADVPVNIQITVVPQDTFNENWDDVKVSTENITVNLSKTYTVTFVSQGNVVSVQEYTSGNPSVSIPDVPKIPGLLNGRWENYDLSAGGDITVSAIYDSPVVFLPARMTLSVNEQCGVVASSNLKNVTKEWKTSDSNVAVVDGHGRITAVSEGECMVTVICTAADELGNTIKVTDTVLVIVKTAEERISFKDGFRRSFDDFFRYTLHDFVENIAKIFIYLLLPLLNINQ